MFIGKVAPYLYIHVCTCRLSLLLLMNVFNSVYLLYN